MRRVVAFAVVLLALAGSPLRADTVADQITSLSGGSVKLRLRAAAALSGLADDRAVVALAASLRDDKDASVRRAAALALAKVVSRATGKAARTKAMDALKAASEKKHEKNKKVRTTAAKVWKDLTKALAPPKGPPVFVTIDPTEDTTKRAPARAVKELDKSVKAMVTKASYSFEWPGDAMPTGKELEKNGTTAFIVGASVTKLAFDKQGSKVTVSCTVEVKVSPWSGSDGGERWIAGQTAKASGNGKAESGTSDASMAGGVVECVKAVGERVVGDKVTPHIKKVLKAAN